MPKPQPSDRQTLLVCARLTLADKSAGLGRGLVVLENFPEFSPDATDVRVLTILLTSPRYLFRTCVFHPVA